MLLKILNVMVRAAGETICKNKILILFQTRTGHSCVLCMLDDVTQLRMSRWFKKLR